MIGYVAAAIHPMNLDSARLQFFRREQDVFRVSRGTQRIGVWMLDKQQGIRYLIGATRYRHPFLECPRFAVSQPVWRNDLANLAISHQGLGVCSYRRKNPGALPGI